MATIACDIVKDSQKHRATDSELPTKRLWDKLSASQKRMWRVLYRRFRWDLQETAKIQGVKAGADYFHSAAHNAALLAVWEMEG